MEFSDPDVLSSGVDGSLGLRQAMPVFNTAWHTNEFFWDGRAHLLRDQSLKPIQDELEMKETLPSVVAKLESDQIYLDQFTRAFGDETITSERMSLAPRTVHEFHRFKPIEIRWLFSRNGDAIGK